MGIALELSTCDNILHINYNLRFHYALVKNRTFKYVSVPSQNYFLFIFATIMYLYILVLSIADLQYFSISIIGYSIGLKSSYFCLCLKTIQYTKRVISRLNI